MADLIVKAAVKEELDDMNVASDFYNALDDEVEEILEDAARRAEANDRKTVQPRDLYGRRVQFSLLSTVAPLLRQPLVEVSFI